jgi:hypothetical protein
MTEAPFISHTARLPLRVPPENVCEAVTIEVASSDDRPYRWDYSDSSGRGQLCAVHKPQRGGSGGCFSPQQVAEEISVEISLADDTPVGR